jgi:hypothetical protein
VQGVKGSIYLRGNMFWMKLGHPEGGGPIRFSLETSDPARAQLLAKKIAHLAVLQRPVLRELTLPDSLPEFLQPAPVVITPIAPAVPPEVQPPAPIVTEKPRLPINEVLIEYVAFIRRENSPRHAENKINHLKAFFGAKLLGLGSTKGSFSGASLEDVRIADVRQFLEGLPLATKTKRHYRETFHHLFEVAMRYGFYTPTNYRYPNPMATLPGYHSRNNVIVYLTAGQKEALFALLKGHPVLEAAVRLMIHGGFRRGEAVWLKRSSVSPDLKFISVVNQLDEETEAESTLKTGARSVIIIPELREFLAAYWLWPCALATNSTMPLHRLGTLAFHSKPMKVSGANLDGAC